MSLFKNATYNILGAALPSALTLVTVPLYLQFVGIERYGVLALCWVFLSYSAFMDFGLGLAVARLIAKSRDGGPEAAEGLWTAIWLSLAFSAVAAVAVYGGGLYYFGSVADLTPSFRTEVASAIPVIAAMVPILMLSGVLGGALQGRERFLVFNGTGMLGNTLLAILPLIFAYFWSPTLPVLLFGALLARLTPLPWLFLACRRAVPLTGARRPSPAVARSLLGFGGWVSLTSITTVVLNSADRLAIGSALGAAAVSVYTIPYNLMSRVYIIPHSLGPVLFARFASLDQAERDKLLVQGVRAVAAIITPILIGAVLVVEPFFTLWIGAELTRAALPISYVFAMAFWFYCLGYPAQSVLQASGRPDLVSKVLAAEVVPFIAGLLLALAYFGLMGAALVFMLRSLVEALALLVLARISWSALKPLLPAGGLTLAAVVAAYGLDGLAEYLVLIPLLIAASVWSWIHAPQPLRDRLGQLLAAFTRSRRDA